MNDALIEDLALYSNDPVGFVHWAFPWGSGELTGMTGPEQWQLELLDSIGKGLISAEAAVRTARASGHGIGKSACVSWIILWAVSTFPDTRAVITANTETQLRTKTWAELAKWYRLFIGRDLFKMTATALYSADPEHDRTWRCDMVPWSKERPESFAGLHNQGRRILVIFDEASAIPDVIWETTEGALTDRDTQIIWSVFGNPTESKGRFRACFEGGQFAHRWDGRAIDARTVSITDKRQHEAWLKDYGEDSDFFRVKVRGVFPRIDSSSFISHEIATEAVNREILPQTGAVVIGVDVARFGDDASVIFPRCGRDAVSRPVEVYQGLDTMAFAAKVAAAYHRYNAACVMVDAGGVGGGVADRLRMLRIPVVDVDFSANPDGINPDDGTKYARKRDEIWGAMRGWLPRGSIPALVTGENRSLVDELVAPNYHLNQNDAIKIESKSDMRRRGVPSPNAADALACTFAAPHYEYEAATASDLDNEIKDAGEYDPFTHARIYG